MDSPQKPRCFAPSAMMSAEPSTWGGVLFWFSPERWKELQERLNTYAVPEPKHRGGGMVVVLTAEFAAELRHVLDGISDG